MLGLHALERFEEITQLLDQSAGRNTSSQEPTAVHTDCVSGVAVASYVIGNGSTHSVNETKDMNNFLNRESHLRAHVVKLKDKFVSQLLVQPIQQSL